MKFFRCGAVLAFSILAGACVAGTPPAAAPTPVVAAGPATPEQRLRQTLARESPDAILLDSLSTQFGDPRDYHRKLADIASDSTASEVVRGNAFIQLGARYATDQARVFVKGVVDPSVRVRASTAAGLAGLLAVSTDSLLETLIVVGMHDKDDRVQAKALESVGDRSPQLLRNFLREQPGPSQQIRDLAQQLLEVAENRGAPLTPLADGAYQRVSTGVTLRYEPRRSWTQWDASVGVLRTGKAGEPLDSIANDVEVVAGVVPAFVSKDGRFLVYEAGRRIFLRDVQARTTKLIGDGVAPRDYPFQDSFLYLRERAKDRSETRTGGTQMFYDVVRVPFAGGEPQTIAEVSATAQFAQRGGFSPVRWMRVRESTGAFMIEAEGMASTLLPDPFAAKQGQ